MSEPMKIRAHVTADLAEIRVLMSHPMETGRRQDAEGKLVPEHYIRNVTIDVAGRRVLTTQWGMAVAKNPFLGIRVRGAKVGDKVVVTWADTAGETRTDEAVLAPKPSA